MKYLNTYILVSTLALMPIFVGCSEKTEASAPQNESTHVQKMEHMHQQSAENMHGTGVGHQLQESTRTEVFLTAGERQHVLMEMRGLLESTQGIIEGLGSDDMKQVQESALAAGTEGRNSPKNQIMHKKMPTEWMQLGMKAHTTMDEIAQMAADAKPANDIQLKLVEAMNACVACHATYKLPKP